MILTSPKLENLIQNCLFFALILSALAQNKSSKNHCKHVGWAAMATAPWHGGGICAQRTGYTSPFYWTRHVLL